MMHTELRRETLADQIAQRLAEYIEQQQLAPGEMLPSETKLSTEFGVSRPIIREALKSLAAQGLIVVANGKGAMVRPLDGDALISYFHRAVRVRREAIMELVELRRAVELQNAGLAAERRTEEEASALQEIVAKMRSCLDDQAQWTELDSQLHLCVARATRNEMIYYLTESIREPIKDSMREGFRHRRDATQLDLNQRVHEDLVAAILRADPPAAIRAMEQHFDMVKALLHDGGGVV